jgi:hypothetical protein
MNKTQLLPPFAEGHSGVLDEEPLDGPLAGARSFGKLLKSLTNARRCKYGVGDATSARVTWARQLKGYSTSAFDLVLDHGHQVGLSHDVLVKLPHATRVSDKFLKEWCNVEYGALSWEGSQTRGQIEGLHLRCPGHCDRMYDAGGDPNCASSRYDPQASIDPDGHDAAHGVHELIVVVKMLGHLVAAFVPPREGRDSSSAAPTWVIDRPLSLLRHKLAA